MLILQYKINTLLHKRLRGNQHGSLCVSCCSCCCPQETAATAHVAATTHEKKIKGRQPKPPAFYTLIKSPLY